MVPLYVDLYALSHMPIEKELSFGNGFPSSRVKRTGRSWEKTSLESMPRAESKEQNTCRNSVKFLTFFSSDGWKSWVRCCSTTTVIVLRILFWSQQKVFAKLWTPWLKSWIRACHPQQQGQFREFVVHTCTKGRPAHFYLLILLTRTLNMDSCVQCSRYRSLPLNPNMDNLNSWLIQSPMEIT